MKRKRNTKSSRKREMIDCGRRKKKKNKGEREEST
jgi:hypothetical protein